ncbi:hypothetical protein N431DRAFT_479708 [Stipitochalara longipes BDJ]|nr:hypothetical protein N431DRAFT_479708 [Stipitochalara longipes BDJ]
MADSGESRPKSHRDRPIRKYGFACANCRKRKARCDGRMPSCGRCIAHNENCHFDKGPSIAFALAQQDRIASLDSLIERLRAAEESQRLRILEEHFNQEVEHPRPAHRRRPEGTNEHSLEASPPSDTSLDDDLSQLLKETSIDESGRVCFYGSTSFYHVEAGLNSLPPQDTLDNSITSTQSVHSPEPWESEVVSQNTSLPQPLSGPLSTTPEFGNGQTFNEEYHTATCQDLLATYWCWPHHLHLVLCRNLFMRDIATFGPYAPPFLFYAVLAQAARYHDRSDAPSLSQHYAERALESLPAELRKGSSIPAIQGLLILSARECGCGRTSQGWLYSGMAFRMMRDLGIHIHPERLNHLVGNFSPDQMALRQQIFWSCYTWDKTMSLCLGRPPSIHDSIPVLKAESFLDGTVAEEELWKPRFANPSPMELGTSQKSSTITRFIAYCHLCVIIDDVLENLYSHGHATKPQTPDFLNDSIQKLDTWRQELPPNIDIDPRAVSISCPPLHILLLNLLYHATRILLCRPYRSLQQLARKTTTEAAEAIDHLLMLHIRRFGFRVITYLESYTVFIASTANILDMKDGIGGENARARLALNLEILRNASSTPSNTKCIRVIEQLYLGFEHLTASPRRTSHCPTQQDDHLSTIIHSNTQLQHPNRANTSIQSEIQVSTLPGQRITAFTRMEDQGDLSLNSQEHPTNETGLQESSGLQTHINSSMEIPLHWMSETASSDGWMMPRIDYQDDLNNALFLGTSNNWDQT